MNKKRFTIFFTIIILLLLSSHIISAQKKEIRLFEVKNIYLEQFEAGKHKEFRQMLKEEFSRRMFRFVDKIEDADAALLVKLSIEVTLDGDKEDLPKPIYQFEFSSLDNKMIWKKELQFATKGSFEKDDEFAAKKIVNKFVEDWAKSKRKNKN